MISRPSKKLGITLVVILCATALCWRGILNGGQWVAAVGIALGIYLPGQARIDAIKQRKAE